MIVTMWWSDRAQCLTIDPDGAVTLLFDRRERQPDQLTIDSLSAAERWRIDAVQTRGRYEGITLSPVDV